MWFESLFTSCGHVSCATAFQLEKKFITMHIFSFWYGNIVLFFAWNWKGVLRTLVIEQEQVKLDNTAGDSWHVLFRCFSVYALKMLNYPAKSVLQEINVMRAQARQRLRKEKQLWRHWWPTSCVSTTLDKSKRRVRSGPVSILEATSPVT